MKPPAWYGETVGWAALLFGAAILVRDLTIHSLGYALAGLALIGFGAWRLQVSRRAGRR